ncbi:MAG TPA: Mov34/MPN/PAD-1 family protein [Chloroflexota bacterium]|nr:Mov34/MPN/PAD-1 family protein [Chloroflexota bacterium]HUM67588.1 Mov34/MPN/PAD-1 family protein [Chloroflexota bacterium]
MFDNLVTYHVHQSDTLPANEALAYQYVLAGNGVFVRAETCFFTVLLPVTACTVRGLEPLFHSFQLHVPRMPARLLATILSDARRARRPSGGRPDNGLNEVLYQFHHHGQTVHVKKPPQQATAVSVLAPGSNDATILCDLHSHGNMPAFFSQTDDADEQAAKLYAVVGNLDTAPEIRLRVGVYGYWMALPVTAVFTGNGPFNDLHEEKNHDK